MMQAFMVVLREGIEAFLIVAITFAYLRKTKRNYLIPSALWGVAGSVLVSGILGYWLWKTQGAHQPLWEGSLAVVTAILVVSFVIHMQKVGPHFKQDVEQHIDQAAKKSASSFIGIFLFTVLMISREGMEMVLLLLQIQGQQLMTGVFLGILAAAAVAVLWQQFGYLINLKKFFQITSVFLVLFSIQIAVQAFHEFTEAGIFPNSEALHAATEPYSTAGVYGKLYSNVVFFGCAFWLMISLFSEKVLNTKKALQNF